MKKHSIVMISIFIILLTLSCTIYSDGWDITGDPDPEEVAREQLLKQMEAASTEQARQYPQNSSANENLQEGTVKKVNSPDDQTNKAGINEYAVSATNFGCTCTVDNSSMSIELKIEGEQLEYAGFVYNKVSENTYKRSYMGYYILESGEGDNKTSTQVDEERHDIIILTENGFISEHYQGDESSPCCYHTFTMHK